MSSDKPTVEDIVWNPETGQWEFNFDKFSESETDFPVTTTDQTDFWVESADESDFPVESEAKSIFRSQFFWQVVIAALGTIGVMLLGLALADTYQEFGIVGLAAAWLGMAVLAFAAMKNNNLP